MNIITCKNVGKKYAEHIALHDINLEIKEGIIFGLLGPNGAGKTSLIRMITQILGYDTGEILFRNELLQPLHSKYIGYLPEERGLYKKMKVGEQLIYFAQLKNLSSADARTQVNYWLEKFDLVSWKEKSVEELSKGMQQKVQFIATIIHRPQLVILDEPFSGFDPINAEVLKTEIQEMKSQGQSIIFSTHRMESVDELCDNIALINNGRKILEGSVLDVKRKFYNNIFVVEGRGTLPASSMFQVVTLEENQDGFKKATIKLNKCKSNEVLAFLLPTFEIISFIEKLPDMNEIFVSLVNENHNA